MDENSKAYQVWKSYHGRSYFEQLQWSRHLCLDDNHGIKWYIDAITIKDFGAIHYLSWTESSPGGTMYLKIFELGSSGSTRRLEWLVEPSDGHCFFWISKWTEKGLYIVYRDEKTNYALHISIGKRPSSLSLNVIELGPLLCIKSDWTIGYKNYGENTVSVFDLKNFVPAASLDEAEAIARNIIPTEQGEQDEELT